MFTKVYCLIGTINTVDVFRSSKYLIILSPASIEILKQYLIRHSHIILLQMINCWFDFEEKKSVDMNTIESEENEPLSQVSFNKN